MPPLLLRFIRCYVVPGKDRAPATMILDCTCFRALSHRGRSVAETRATRAGREHRQRIPHGSTVETGC